MRTRRTLSAARLGTTILELVMATSILVIILLSVFAVIERDSSLARSTLGITVAEMRAQQMLRRLQGDLADARGANPIASITTPLDAVSTDELVVDWTLGFPDSGTLLLDRGTANEERIRYSGLSADRTRFLGLERGVDCTTGVTHAAGGELLWGGLAEPLALQQNPPAGTFDGIANEPGGPVFFRGDGTGFSYRVPVDPDNNVPPNYLDGDELRWGAWIRSGPNGALAPSTDGWSAIVFVPVFEVREDETGDDINHDGDTEDVFDLGQIRRRSWSTADPTVPVFDLGLGPTAVLQEQCNHGGDLDGDGFDDPIFLWDREQRRLHVRLFILGRTVRNQPIVRRVDSMIFLRNEPEG